MKLKKPLLFCFIFVLFLCLSAVVFNFLMPQPTFEKTKTFDSLQQQEDFVILKFDNDVADSIFYEVDGQTFDCLSVLQKGDVVTIVLEQNYQNFTYAIIHKMTLDNQVVFDFEKHYFDHSINTVVITESFVFGCLLSWALFVVLGTKKRPDVILAPPHAIDVFFTLFLAGSASGFFAFLLLFLIGNITVKTFAYSFCFLLLAGICTFGLVYDAKDKTTFSNGIYKFGKKQIFPQEIDRVEIEGMKALLYGNNNEVLHKISRNLNHKSSFGFVDSLKSNGVAVWQLIGKQQAIDFAQHAHLVFEEYKQPLSLAICTKQAEYIFVFDENGWTIYKKQNPCNKMSFNFWSQVVCANLFDEIILQNDFDKITKTFLIF